MTWDVWSDGWPVQASLVTGPVIEPLTPADLKLRARHDRTDEDALLPDYIRAARQQVEQDIERALLTQTWRARVYAASGPQALTLPVPPLQEVTSVYGLTAMGDSVLIDPSAYAVDLVSGRMLLADTEGVYYVFTIDYVAGALTVAEIPPLLLQAVGILAVHYLTLGRDLVSAGTLVPVPQSYLDAIQPFRQVSLI